MAHQTTPTDNQDELAEMRDGREGSACAVAETAAPRPSLRLRFIGREHMHHDVWALAWPTIIANVLMNFGSLLNVWFVHFLGVHAMDAVAWGEQMIAFVFSVAVGISVGTTALVARSIGAGEHRTAADATRQSLLLGVALGAVTTAILLLSARPLLLAIGATPQTLPLGLTYYRILMWGVVPFFLINVSGAAFRGAGDTRTPVWLLSCMVILNFLLDGALIFGIGPFPKLGVSGAAVASTAVRYAGVCLFLFALWRSPDRLLANGTTWRPSFTWAKRLLRVGVPASIQAGLRNVASAFYLGFLGHMPAGAAVQAAFSVGVRAEGLAFMPGMAFNVAAAALVGQNLGAKDPNRAARAARAATMQSVAVMSLMGLVFFLFATPIAKGLAAAEAVPFAVSYLRIAAISEPFLAIAMTLTGALQGAGDTTKPMWAVMITMWVLWLPLTWYFGLHLGYGASAAWWAMSLSTMLQGLLILAAWRSGAWRRIKV
jgi:putative MATE family efflux protein